MSKFLTSFVMVIALGVVAFSATAAYMADNETSNANTFTAGDLDLSVDSNNGTNTVKFTVSNMSADDQRIGTWKLNNVGSLKGYIDLENIAVTNHENGCVEPETEAGDATCGDTGTGEGELQNVLKLSKLFWDNDCNGWIGTGEGTIYDGAVGAIASNYNTSKELNAGASQCVTGQFNWWSTAQDNTAMGDDLTLDMVFELAETAAQ